MLTASLSILVFSLSVTVHYNIEDDKICLYDFSFDLVSDSTLVTIANLLHCSNDKSFTANIMSMYKQTGVVDCVLYAMAVATCLAFKSDPTTVIFHQPELRNHYAICMEKGKVTLFPTAKKRRRTNRVCSTKECLVYCSCWLSDHGNLMVCCTQCSEWFHEECISEPLPADLDN